MNTPTTSQKGTSRKRTSRKAKGQIDTPKVESAVDTSPKVETKPADPKHTFGKLVMLQSTIVRDLQAFDTAPDAMARTKRQWYNKNGDAARAAVAGK